MAEFALFITRKILLYRIDGLNVRIVTAVALHIAGNQLHRRIARPAAAQTRQQIVVRAISGSLKLKGWMPCSVPMNKSWLFIATHLETDVGHVRPGATVPS